MRLVREFDLALGVDEELVEVPLDVLALHDGRAGAGGSHPRPGRVGLIAVDVRLLDNGEGDTVLRLECDDAISATGLLVAELIARVGDDLEAVVLVVGVDLN